MIHMKTGSFAGTGATLSVNVGFKPGVVILYNITDTGMMIWTADMPDAYSHRTTGSDGIETYTTSLGITAVADGFTLGADTEMNAGTDTIHYIAIRGN